MSKLVAPFPYFGGKSKAVKSVWDGLGDTPNYCEPFAGSAAMLLGRPTPANLETINDIDGLLVIAICGYDIEHSELEVHGWSVQAWGAGKGFQKSESHKRERIWFSPHCLKTQNLFEVQP
jgi:hypothetical protein